MLGYCKIREVYQYKRADMYKLKVQMDRELIERGSLLGECTVIDNEDQAYSVFEGEL